MARLNEPVAPTESVDALKRRFIRQNREIARVNSTQSLRIRNLEAEISRLLAENIALREQAIASAYEVERLRSNNCLVQDAQALKEKLELKLHEVSLLVLELGSLPEKATRRTSIKRKSGVTSTIKSPDQKDWRNRQTIGGVLAGEREEQDGRLPAILEDKSYPRKTLDSTELHKIIDIANATSESPDLGPPPIAHFEVPEPLNFELSKFDRGHTTMATDAEDAVHFSANLETRRKRRTSSSAQDFNTNQCELNREKPFQNATPLFKSGAKRKLDVSDNEEKAMSRQGDSEDFAYQRKAPTNSNLAPARKGTRFMRPPGRPEATTPSSTNIEAPLKPEPAVRKILAPKSTNSPSKRQQALHGKIAALSGDLPKQSLPHPGPAPPKSSTIFKDVASSSDPDRNSSLPHPVELAPKTPAGLDLISPASTEPSSKHIPRDQEMTVINSVEDVLNGSIGRAGSRRARAAVSYAEPSLRDKMRRPGKELVGAVEGIDRGREVSVRAESVVRSQTKERTVKEEKNTEESSVVWKSLPHRGQSDEEPASPLREKSVRTSDEQRKSKNEFLRESKAVEEKQNQLESAVTGLSIFDPPNSSPCSASTTTPEGDVQTSGAAALRTVSVKGRRHSINPNGLGRNAQSVPDLKKQTHPSSRPSSTASTRLEGAEDRASTTVAEKRSANVAVLKESRHDNASVTAAAMGRGERAAVRRRSMMI